MLGIPLSLGAVALLAMCLFGRRDAEGASINSYMGPFKIVAEELHQCTGPGKDPKLYDISWDGQLKYNGTIRQRVLAGSITYNRKLVRGRLAMHLDIAKWDPVSGWREHFFVLKLGDTCNIIETMGRKVWLAAIRYLHPQMPLSCPVPQAVYRTDASGFLATWENLSDFPVAPYGRYRGLAWFTDPEDVCRLCFQLVCKFVPKV